MQIFPALLPLLALGIGIAASPLSAAGPDDRPAESHAEAGDEADQDSPDPAPLPPVLPVPIGVDFNVPLLKGEWKPLYRYQRIDLDPNRDEKNDLTIGMVDDRYDFDQAPTHQDIDIHEFGILYAPHGRITLAAEIPYVRKRMSTAFLDPITGAGYDTRSSGVGDLLLTAIVPFMRKGREGLDVSVGLSIPTGSINFTNSQGQLLPYDMQIGSGTWDLLAALTYRGSWSRTGWGMHFSGLFRQGWNHWGYRLGNDYEVTGWVTQGVTDWLSGSFRVEWSHWNNVRGNSQLGPANNPASDGYLRSGTRLDLGPALTLALPFAGTQSLSIEALWPVMQDLDGPQLARDWTLYAGWQWVF